MIPTAPATSADSGAREQEKSGRTALPVLRRILWALGVSGAWAVLCDLVLEGSMRVHGSAPLVAGPALVGMVIVWVAIIGLVGVFGRLRLALTIAMVAVATVGAINVARMKFLMEPLMPSDVVYLANPGFLVQMVGWRQATLAAVAWLAFVVTLVLAARWASRDRPAPPGRGQSGWRVWTAFRVVAVTAGGLLVAFVPTFHHPDNPIQAMYAAVGTEWLTVSHAANYRGNGFIGGALFNVQVDPMPRPADYSPARMQEIVDSWSAQAERANRGADDAVLAETNVVVVLSESMGDPLALQGIRFSEDPIPQVRALMREWGGHMFAAKYGTGTSLMEFSVLTGQAGGFFNPQVVSPYQQFVPDAESYPSAVGWLRSQGHSATAIHPYEAALYRRPEAYATLGFDRFLDEGDVTFRAPAVPGGFISDRSAYDEVLRTLRSSSDPSLVHLVTMQNHTPYQGLYADPVEVSAGPGSGDLGGWARGLAHSDDAVAYLLDELEELDEPTVVIHFGDHFPGIFDAATVEAEGIAMRRTPWFVWSNRGEAADRPGLTAPAAALGEAMRRIGAPMPPYLLMLERLQDEVGTVLGDTVVTTAGDVVAIADLDSTQRELIEEARLVQYDFSVGARYALEGLWYDPTP